MGSKQQNPIYIRPETSLFEESPIDISLISSGMVEYHPLSNVSDRSGPISFNIKGNDIHYLDCSQMALYLRAKIEETSGNLNAAGKLRAYADVKAAPVNNLLHSLFQQCTVHLNETQITPATSLYAYRSYIETVLGYGGDYKDTQARAALYVKDEDVSSTADSGFQARNEVTKDGLEFDLIGKPCVDICSQNRFIIPGVDMRISFHRATNDDFYMHSEATNPAMKYKCTILEARLLIKKHTVLPVILSQHLKLLDSGFNCSYPMIRNELKTYSLPIGTIQNVNENLINGIMPTRIIIALCKSEAMNGSLITSPFDFRDFGLKQISISANGDQIYSQSYDIDVANNRVSELYYNMFNALGLSGSNEGPDISLKQFVNGKLFFVYNLRENHEGTCVPRHGNIKIDLKFKAALTHAVNVLCHVDYQTTLYIDQNRSVFFKDLTTTSF
jgi:hypothetical protein